MNQSEAKNFCFSMLSLGFCIIMFVNANEASAEEDDMSWDSYVESSTNGDAGTAEASAEDSSRILQAIV